MSETPSEEVLNAVESYDGTVVVTITGSDGRVLDTFNDVIGFTIMRKETHDDEEGIGIYSQSVFEDEVYAHYLLDSISDIKLGTELK